MRFHDRVMIAHFPATLAQVANQFLTRFELRPCRLIAIEIANQANAESNVVEIITMDVASVDLPPPAISDFDVAVAGGCAVADHEMIGKTVLHPPDVAMVIIEHRGVALTRPAIVDHDVLPARLRHRRAVDRGANRGR